jgi:proteasome-associated ATPase
MTFREGEPALLVDSKGRHFLLKLDSGRTFQFHNGSVPHDELIGAGDGTWVESSGNARLLLLRPRLADFILKMKRGAQVVYPKDLGPILVYADIGPGMTVLEAGTGSGALTMGLARAVGAEGRVVTVELRDDHADHARKTLERWFGEVPAHVEMRVGDVAAAVEEVEPERIVLDVPEPWHTVEAAARFQNDKLASVLEEAREQLSVLRAEVEKLTTPPNNFGTVLQVNDDGTVDVMTGNRKLRVAAQPTIEVKELSIGQEVLLNESLNIVDIRGYERSGEVVRVREKLADGRVVVIARADEEQVLELSDSMKGQKFRAGDFVRIDPKSGLIYERLARPEVEELVLEEVPDVTYDQVGGLVSQIEEIRDAVELPYVHKDLFGDYGLVPPKGILLYGPPGCGKTLIAKAVANSLATAVAERTGNPDTRSYFLNVKGPELLNKWVGETERQIRLIFQRAKEKSDEGVPVIVFFDEMDSLFRTRGSGISSDVESTIVPQLLSELDGVEALKNVIVIGASNREDLIDPAILRPGRLDVKIKINRPDPVAARQIFRIYLDPSVPLDEAELESVDGDAEAMLKRMIDRTVEAMYSESDENRFLEVTYANGDRELLYFKDFSSGAMIENIVRRAKKDAIKREIAGGKRGVKTEDLLVAIKQEFREHEDLPNTTNPDDWAKISGKKGERIVYVRTLVEGDAESRMIERVSTGQYL